MSLLVVSSLLFALMAWVARHATARVGGAESAFLRFVVGVLAVVVVVRVRGVALRFVRHDLIFLRGLFGGLAVLLYFVAMARLPAGTATLLNYTAPVFTAVFAAIFLGERLPARNLVAMAIAGVGVVLVIHGQGKALGGERAWMAVALVSAVASGAAVTSIRAARRTDGAWEVFFGFCAIGALVTGPIAVAVWVWPSPTEWALLVVVGLLAVGAQILMTYALGGVPAATSGVIAQITVIGTFALGHFLDNEVITGWAISGSILTIAGVATAAWMSNRTANA